MLTSQQVYDTVKNHLMTQGRRAVDRSAEQCLYRSPDGTKCAAGCLIKDEFYRSKFEGNNVVHPDVADALLKSGVDRSDIRMVSELQSVHDTVLPDQWEFEVELVASRFGLKP